MNLHKIQTKILNSLNKSKVPSSQWPFVFHVCSGWCLGWVDPLELVLIHVWPWLSWPYPHVQAAPEWWTALPWPNKTNKILQHCCLPRWVAHLDSGVIKKDACCIYHWMAWLRYSNIHSIHLQQYLEMRDNWQEVWCWAIHLIHIAEIIRPLMARPSSQTATAAADFYSDSSEWKLPWVLVSDFITGDCDSFSAHGHSAFDNFLTFILPPTDVLMRKSHSRTFTFLPVCPNRYYERPSHIHAFN